MRTFVALCALLLCLTPVADAQSAAPSAPEIAAPEIAAPEIAAPEVAATVQRFYGGLTTLELGFTQSYWSDAYGRNLRTSAGTLRIRRPGRLRFDYTTPAGQVMTAVDDRTEGATAGVVSAVSIETLAGDWNNFRFPEAAMRIDPTFDAATFDYTPPAEAREITPPA